MRKYFWAGLPQELQNEFFEEAVKRTGDREKADDYINRNNFHQTLSEWEETIINSGEEKEN